MTESATNTTEPKAFRASLGVSLNDSAVLAVLYRQSDLATTRAMGLVERPYIFDYFGLELPLTAETTADELVDTIEKMHVVRAEAYAKPSLSKATSEQVLTCRGGDTVDRGAVSAVQRAQMWGNELFKRGSRDFEQTRYIFEFNREKVVFNPWTADVATQIANDALAAQETRGVAYFQSAAYAEAQQKSKLEQETLKQQEAMLMSALPEKLKGPLPDLMRWVTAYAKCHDRVGVTTEPSAVVLAFAEEGFKENAFVGPQFKELLKSDKDKFGRYVIGQFLNILPMKCGMPGILWYSAEQYLAMPDA